MFRRYTDALRSLAKASQSHPASGGNPLAAAADGPWRATHRHRKGGHYRVLGQCLLEADRADAVIYDDQDGTIWVRAKAEFYDGRFTALPEAPASDHAPYKALAAAPKRAGKFRFRVKSKGLGRLNFADEKDLRQLQKLSTPLWIFDVERPGIWWANPQGLAFWKAESVDEIRKRDFSTDSTTVRDRLRQIVELATEDAHITDTWTLFPKGEPQTTVLSFQPVEIEGRIKGILIELVEVLERDADDDTWRLLEAARATSLMITTFATDGKLLTQNPAALACYGALHQTGAKQTDLEARFVDKSIAAQVLSKAAANQTAHWEANVRTAAGVRTHSLSVRKGRDPINGNFLTVLSEEDVTEYARLRERQNTQRAQLEEEVAKSSDKLRVSQERYELAVQNAAICDWDALEDRIFMSPNFLNVLGYTLDDFAGQTTLEIFERIVHTDDFADTRKEFQDHFDRPGDTMAVEIRFVTRAGETVSFNCQGNCVRDGFGNVTRFVGLLNDITERKRLEKKLLGSQRMEAIGQLTGGIAHDFNNLLTVIQGNAELLEATGSCDDELTSEIVSAARRGADLTRHLLAFARQQTLIPKQIDLNELVPKTIKSLLRTISETVTVEFKSTEDLWTIHADRTQLETAILNLALNARDAMPTGGTLTITCRNAVSEQIAGYDESELDQDRYVAISVSDTGEGMSGDARRKAFEPFYTTKGVGQGSGLGLSMVLGFSRQSGGDTRIKSSPGIGTNVTIYLPESQRPDEVEAVPTQTEITHGNCENIHILEDNAHVQQVVSKLVRSLGYNVTVSNNVMQARDHVQSGKPTDLYLVDILLPGGHNGVDFAHGLRAQDAGAKILFMSGFSDNHLIENSALERDTTFIAKPFDRSAISHAIRAALEDAH